VRGAPGLEVYLDNAFRGHVLPSGVLLIEQLKPGEHDLSILARNSDPITQKVSLNAAMTVFNVDGRAIVSPLVSQIRKTLKEGDVRGAFDLYQQLIKQSPADPQRVAIEMSLSSVFESIGQKAINAYVQSSGAERTRGMFYEAAEAYRLMKTIQPNVPRETEAKHLFCGGRAMIEELRFDDAVVQLNKAVTLDPRAAYAYHALGEAYQGLKKPDLALAAMRRASELSPAWALPRIQLGAIYLEQGMSGEAEEALNEAARIDPDNYMPREELARFYLKEGSIEEAALEADKAISLGSNTGGSYLVQGQVYEKMKVWRLAADAYEKGLRLSSDLSKDERKEFTKRLEKCRKKAD
jgi:tetratricopeptide (TPR) repeat protein